MASYIVRAKAAPKTGAVTKKKAVDFVVSAPKKAMSRSEEKVLLSDRTASKRTTLLAQEKLPTSSTRKAYKATLRAASKGAGKTVVIWSANNVLEARTTVAPEKVVTQDLSRREVVGKHPEIKLRPAPKSKLKLDEKTRQSLLASMVLF